MRANNFLITQNVYKQFNGGSYISLLKWIANKKTIVNIKNIGEKCWSITPRHYILLKYILKELAITKHLKMNFLIDNTKKYLYRFVLSYFKLLFLEQEVKLKDKAEESAGIYVCFCSLLCCVIFLMFFSLVYSWAYKTFAVFMQKL